MEKKSKTFWLDEYGDPRYVKIAVIAVVALFAVITFFLSFTTVNSGEVGIRTRFGKIQETTAVEGINLKVPYIEKIVKVNVKVQKADVEAAAASKDLQEIKAKFVVNYQIDASKATELYRNVGSNYEDVILAPAIQEAFKAVTAKFTAEEMITRRGEISIQVVEALQNKVKEYGIFIRELNITNLDFSPEYNAAIEAKQVAEQQVKKAEQELAKAKIDAEKQIAQAKAEAEALKLQKSEITKDLLELRKIEAQLEAIKKWDGKLPQYNLGDGAIPFIDLK